MADFQFESDPDHVEKVKLILPDGTSKDVSVPVRRSDEPPECIKDVKARWLRAHDMYKNEDMDAYEMVLHSANGEGKVMNDLGIACDYVRDLGNGDVYIEIRKRTGRNQAPRSVKCEDLGIQPRQGQNQ